MTPSSSRYCQSFKSLSVKSAFQNARHAVGTARKFRLLRYDCNRPRLRSRAIWLQRRRSESSGADHLSPATAAAVPTKLTEEGVRIKMSLLLSNRSVLTILSRVACRLFKQASLFKQQTTLQAPLGWILNGSAWQQHGQRSLTFTTTSPNLLLRLKFMVFLNFLCGAKHLSPTAETRFIWCKY